MYLSIELLRLLAVNTIAAAANLVALLDQVELFYLLSQELLP